MFMGLCFKMSDVTVRHVLGFEYVHLLAYYRKMFKNGTVTLRSLDLITNFSPIFSLKTFFEKTNLLLFFPFKK